MLRSDATLALGTLVTYTSDRRISGVVVGHGVVHESTDIYADESSIYNVVLVKLDRQARELLSNGLHMSFPMPFVASVLEVTS